MPNYTHHPAKLSAADERVIVERYRNTPSLVTAAIAKEYNCSGATIAACLRRHIPEDEYRHLKLIRNPSYRGEEEAKRKRKFEADRSYAFGHRVNHQCFAGDLTPEKAYWIGFLLADGCVYKNRICVELQRADKEHIEKFQRFVSGEFYNIRNVDKNGSCSLRFVSWQISFDLSKYGVVPRKSLTNEFAKNIPDEFMWHYLRGLFDGDGSVHVDTRPRVVVQIAGSYIFCAKLLMWLEQHGVHGIGPYMNKKSQVCTVQVQSGNAVSFLHLIYGESAPETRLTRKGEMAFRILQNSDQRHII